MSFFNKSVRAKSNIHNKNKDLQNSNELFNEDNSNNHSCLYFKFKF